MNRGEAVVREAYRAACLAELDALKPGNVHRFAAGHDMTVEDFERSAEVTAPLLVRPGLGVGEAIYLAVEATRRAVSCNTNLGILLLCAPLVRAALTVAPSADAEEALQSHLDSLLHALDRRDADHAFRAIRLARPGGLGSSERHDVAAPATVTLREAMAEAKDRDRVAAQYANSFADLFQFGLPCLRSHLARWGRGNWATSGLYLGFLARFPDSHVARKFGAARAEALRLEAAALERLFRESPDPESFQAELMALDRSLKAEGINPGTSADLTVATLFLQFISAADAAAQGCEPRPI